MINTLAVVFAAAGGLITGLYIAMFWILTRSKDTTEEW